MRGKGGGVSDHCPGEEKLRVGRKWTNTIRVGERKNSENELNKRENYRVLFYIFTLMF